MGSYPRTENLSDARSAELTEELKLFRVAGLRQFKGTVQDLDKFVAKFYLEDAILFAPTGKFRGHGAIRAGFKVYESAGEGTSLRVWDENILIFSETRALVLSGKWEFGSTRGIVRGEDWYKQDDGTWKMLIDSFDVLKDE